MKKIAIASLSLFLFSLNSKAESTITDVKCKMIIGANTERPIERPINFSYIYENSDYKIVSVDFPNARCGHDTGDTKTSVFTSCAENADMDMIRGEGAILKMPSYIIEDDRTAGIRIIKTLRLATGMANIKGSFELTTQKNIKISSGWETSSQVFKGDVACSSQERAKPTPEVLPTF